jgi:hypothetical protein
MRRGIFVVAIALVVASCDGSDADKAQTPPPPETRAPPLSAAKPGTYSVAELTETFDTSRPTEGAAGTSGMRSCTRSAPHSTPSRPTPWSRALRPSSSNDGAAIGPRTLWQSGLPVVTAELAALA